ncbi:Ima1 N-terminal domain-containing protein [Coprinopsis sp. MPI-PUGE-AT-0042]|nr:Ima1 N-terminal domain-containing protein [Coprinopsis sp. MPI-PUGE-AT-0042]
MHEEQLNRLNFAKRASPSKDQLPNLQRSGPFCHNCQTNQMLIMNLMSNYLPPPESPEYNQRLKQLPVYKESLYSRYPPVCDNCRPAVEEEMQNKEQMARRKALNGWLKGGKERQRQVSGTRAAAVKDKIVVKSLHWRIRGALWFASAAVSISSLVLGLFGHSTISRLHWSLSPMLPLLVIASLLWTAWDPTYLVTQRAHLQGRDVRIQGKRNYIICQMVTWASRLAFSISILLQQRGITLLPILAKQPFLYLSFALCIELLALLAYPLFMRVQHPPPIRLIDTHSHLSNLSNTRSNTPATSSSQNSSPITTSVPKLGEHDLLASLSLSSKPVLTPPPSKTSKPNPIFGMPSFGSSTSLRATAPPSLEPRVKREEDEDAMDWSPTSEEPPRQLRAHVSEDSSTWLRPQRFFAPEKPTGLENIMARTLRLDDDLMQVDPQEPSSIPAILKNWRQWYLPVLFTICAMLAASCAFWLIRLRNPRPPSFEYEPTSYSVSYYDEL